MFEAPKKPEDLVIPALVLLVFYLLWRGGPERATQPDWVGERGRRAPHHRGRAVAGGTRNGSKANAILEDAGELDDYDSSEDFPEEAVPRSELPGAILLQPGFDEPPYQAAVPGGIQRASSEHRETAAPPIQRPLPSGGVSEVIEGRRPYPPLPRSQTMAPIVGGAAPTVAPAHIGSGSSASQARRPAPSMPDHRPLSTKPQAATARTLPRTSRPDKQPIYGDDGSNSGGDVVNSDGDDNVAIDGREDLYPKEEAFDDDDDVGYPPSRAVSVSLPLPPRRETTPHVSTRLRTSSTAEPDREGGVVPVSTRLPPKPSNGSRTPSATGSRASSARTGTVTPTPSTNRRRTTLSSAGGCASATVSRSQSVASSAWTTTSRASSPLTPPPDELSEQWVRKSTSRTTQGGEDGEPGRTIITAWFESVSESLLDAPPDLGDHPDLHPGDLFYHRTPADYQLWIWEADDSGILRWIRVKFMSVRNGMWLTLTPTSQKPSWVSEKHAQSRKRDLRRMGYTV